MTTVGSALWCSILAWYGKGVAERNPDLMKDPEALIHAIKGESLWFVLGILVIGALYFVMLKLTAPKASV